MAKKQKHQPASKVKPTAETVQAISSRPQPVPTPSRKARSVLFSVQSSKAVSLVILAALYPPLSQLILSPVYGSVPSAIYHKYGLIGASLLAFALRGVLPTWVERGLPAFAFWIPSIHLVLFSFSTQLGNPRGPLITEALTCFPLITWSLYMAGRIFDDVDLSFLNSDNMEEAAPSMVLYLLFTIIERVFRDTLPRMIASAGVISSRIGLQLTIATLYGLMLPKSLLWPAVPSIVISMTVNPHNPLQRTTDVLKNTLALHHYSLLERRESVTGYISILEDRQKQFRVMRCDHSLLGGQWLEDGSTKKDRKVAEPIYAVFTMMEAVRLVETSNSQTSKTSDPKRALNIGLGVGTAPAALIAHGVNTTIVELDPLVHYFAIKYFDFPKNHHFYLGDAVGFVEHEAGQAIDNELYDYILHDVFTGGAAPTSLYTFEFLMSLSKLLKPDGTIAINYAGDLNLHSAALVHRTIKAVFPNCRIFREEPEAEPKTGLDFTNLVYFCTHPDNRQPITFRKPVKADYLGSGARQHFLVPKHEVADDKFPNAGIVSRGSTELRALQKWQVQSALGHWRLMRTVIPDVVWENW